MGSVAAVRSTHDQTLVAAMSVARRWMSDAARLVDLFVVGVVALLSLADVASTANTTEDWQRPVDALAYVLVIAGSVSLYWRRRAPIVMLAFVTAVLVTMYLREYGAFLSVLGLPALYAVACHEEHRRRGWWAIGISSTCLVVAACVSVLDRPEGFDFITLVSMVGFLAGAVAAGVIIRNRERIFVDTERRAAQAEADRLAEAERAVVRERSRIAREMHDVVAHSMSVIAVQAAAGREVVHSNPDKAAEVFERIETVGREALAELRRMLGVLRETGDEETALTPQPGIADIAAAVEQSSKSGVTTTLVVDDRQRPLAPGVELAAYRIVQEALTNVRKHAGAAASATVHITYEPQALVIEVSDDGRGAVTSLSHSGGGHGLIGMRERVEIYGGELTSGPRPGGGFVVRAELPVASDTAAATETHAAKGAS
jgi:signal transduction histidine kinase